MKIVRLITCWAFSGVLPIQSKGSDGTETVAIDPQDPTSARVPVNNGAAYRADFNLDPNNSKSFLDPAHDSDNVHQQLFRGSPGQDPINQGFIWDYLQQNGGTGSNTPVHSQNIVDCFSPEKLPVLATLAQEFAVCDHWFSSMPGMTWPNRLFVHAATSPGQVDNNFHEEAYNIDTIYDWLASEFQVSLVKLTKNLPIPGEQAIAQTLRLSQWTDLEHDAANQVRDFATKVFKHLF